MRNIAGRLPVLLAGAVVATGVVTAAPGMSAFACGAEERPATTGTDTTAADLITAAGPSTAAGLSAATAGAGTAAAAVSAVATAQGDRAASAATDPAVRVSGPGSLALRAGSAAPFAVTVTNRGATFAGDIAFEVSEPTGALGVPGIAMEMSTAGGGWRQLPGEGAMGRRWFSADGLTFQEGESSFGFRVTVDAPRDQLRFLVSVTGAAGQAASAGFSVTVTQAQPAAPRLRTTFPGRLQRGGSWREFDVTVGNPSSTTYHGVAAYLSLAAFATGRPTGRTYLAARDIRLERRVGGAWKTVTARDGSCDPGVSATLGGPFDLGPGVSRTVHLRIRLAGSTPATLHAGQYWVSARVPEIEDTATVGGRFVIEPRAAHGGDGQAGDSPATPAGDRSGPSSQPGASGNRPAGTPTGLAHTGAGMLPLLGGTALLLGGVGVLAYARHRRRQAGG